MKRAFDAPPAASASQLGLIPDDEENDPYAAVRDSRAAGAWGKGKADAARQGGQGASQPSRALLLQEMFCEIQDRFGSLSDDDLWNMTPRSFYGKLQQAERMRRRFIADLATAVMYGQSTDAHKHIEALYKALE